MLIKVKAFTKSKEDKVIKKKEDSFDVFVKEKPIDGQANKKIVELLVKYLNINRGDIRIIKGAKEKSKIFNVKF
ncbi:MAG: DUF167 domain-containing protein [Candidatus Pacebacteria bacterium]|nr:DUF167 domain-containing protein [Candidatus Paceibacterota bacterium]